MKARRPLLLLTSIYVLNFVDRQLVGILGQPMKEDLGLSDGELGLLSGLAFALFYTALGIPVARIAERRGRRVVIAASLALWSAMTALCGEARSFPMLALARLGVGLGEAGYVPAAQSLIAEITPSDRRATALSVFSLGIPIGMLVGAVAGGWLAQTLGWRVAFVALGLPGLVLAGLAARLLPEPRHEARTSPATPPPALREVLVTLWHAPGFGHMAAGASIASFAGYGLTSFAVPLLTRAYALPLGVAASGYGVVAGVAIGVGIGGGGWITDRLKRHRAGAGGLVAAAGVILAALLFPFALSLHDPLLFAAATLLPLAGAHLYFGPTYGVTVDSVTPHARAMAIALLVMAMNAIGLGLGPSAVGLLSDWFAATALPGFAESCRPAVSAACRAASASGLTRALQADALLYLWAALHFLLAARALRVQPQSVAR